MVNGKAVIVVSSYGGEATVVVGSYKEITSGGGGGGTFVSTGVSASGVPQTRFVSHGGFPRRTSTKSARFKMLLDENTLEHIHGELDSTINEKIEIYTEGIRIPSEGENLFVSDGKFVHAYYDNKERKLVLTRF